jgi:superfamily II helicase
MFVVYKKTLPDGTVGKEIARDEGHEYILGREGYAFSAEFETLDEASAFTVIPSDPDPAPVKRTRKGS